MEFYTQLNKRIKNKKARICIMGMGYVGLPLALSFADKGYRVYGFDPNYSRVNKLKSGQQYIVDIKPKEVLKQIRNKRFFPTTKEDVLGSCDIIIICVPTPLRKVKIPDISYVVKASRTIKKYLRKGQLVILESTTFPTTTREIILPALLSSGLREEKDFFLCFSPERVNPGDKKFPITKIPKVVGGLSRKSSLLAKALYGKIINNIFVVSSPEVAESAKLLENTFRLVNIALVNEFAIVADKLGINIWEVIEAAKTKPFGFMPFYPGPGVGGHCIPDDPVYLSWKARKLGFKTKMIDLASYMDHYMPKYVVKRLEKSLKIRKISFKKSRIMVLGVTYKKDVKDLRESPAIDIIEILKKKGAKVDYYDPLIPRLKLGKINLKSQPLTGKNLKKYSCVIIVTDHSSIDYKNLVKNAKFIFDTRNIYRKNYNNVERL